MRCNENKVYAIQSVSVYAHAKKNASCIHTYVHMPQHVHTHIHVDMQMHTYLYSIYLPTCALESALEALKLKDSNLRADIRTSTYRHTYLQYLHAYVQPRVATKACDQNHAHHLARGHHLISHSLLHRSEHSAHHNRGRLSMIVFPCFQRDLYQSFWLGPNSKQSNGLCFCLRLMWNTGDCQIFVYLSVGSHSAKFQDSVSK